MIKDLNKAARDIIEQNQHLSLATSDEELGVWNNAVCYSYDHDWNFYFVSMNTSRHSVNLSKNNKVCFTIYDSRQDWGTGCGLQIEGSVIEVGPTEFPKAMTNYFTRKYPFGGITGSFASSLKKMLKAKTYMFYKIVPSKVWMNNPNSDTDERVLIDLNA